MRTPYGQDRQYYYADFNRGRNEQICQLDKPTMLIYGHYDVQPVDPIELWHSDPFEAEVRDNYLYARGSSDDKGQTFIHVKALESIMKTLGKLPVNVKLIIEGEEEIGGPSLDVFIETRRDQLKADVAVIGDTHMLRPDALSGLRAARSVLHSSGSHRTGAGFAFGQIWRRHLQSHSSAERDAGVVERSRWSYHCDEYAGRVGEHYERAGDWVKAAEWYTRAGRQAQNTFASDAALAYYQKALGFFKEYGGLETLQRKFEVYLWLGEVLNWQARFSDAIEVYKEKFNLAQENDNPVAQARALYARAMSLSYQGDNRASLDFAMQAETIARGVDDKLEIARSLWAQGIAHVRLNETQAASALGKEALAMLTELNQRGEAARCLNLLTTGTVVRGELNTVTTQAQNKEAAWKFLRWISGPVGNEMWAKGTGDFPGRNDVAAKQFFKENKLLQAFVQQMQQPNAKSPFLGMPNAAR